jgi:hypothetical protein
MPPGSVMLLLLSAAANMSNHNRSTGHGYVYQGRVLLTRQTGKDIATSSIEQANWLPAKVGRQHCYPHTLLIRALSG